MGKGLSPISPDKISQLQIYLLYFICSDDKINRVSLPLYGKFLEDLTHSRLQRILSGLLVEAVDFVA